MTPSSIRSVSLVIKPFVRRPSVCAVLPAAADAEEGNAGTALSSSARLTTQAAVFFKNPLINMFSILSIQNTKCVELWRSSPSRSLLCIHSACGVVPPVAKHLLFSGLQKVRMQNPPQIRTSCLLVLPFLIFLLFDFSIAHCGYKATFRQNIGNLQYAAFKILGSMSKLYPFAAVC